MLAYGSSDVGRQRSNNEDSFHVHPTRPLWIVADGIGGNPQGEIASALCVEAAKEAANGPFAGQALLGASVALAIKKITAKPRHPDGPMGSTFVGATVEGNRLIVGHIGDSRAYQLTPDRLLHQLTDDHSLGGMLTRWVGPNVEDTPQISVSRAEGRLMLCSDGISNLVDDDTIRWILARARDPGAACELLIDRALDEGGNDNATCIVVFF